MLNAESCPVRDTTLKCRPVPKHLRWFYLQALTSSFTTSSTSSKRTVRVTCRGTSTTTLSTRFSRTWASWKEKLLSFRLVYARSRILRYYSNSNTACGRSDVQVMHVWKLELDIERLQDVHLTQETAFCTVKRTLTRRPLMVDILRFGYFCITFCLCFFTCFLSFTS